MSIPEIRDLVLPVLRAIHEGASATSALRRSLADHFALTEAERDARLGNGQTVFGNRIAFVLRYSGPAGVTQKVASGAYVLTDLGRDLLNNTPDQAAEAVMRGLPRAQRTLQPQSGDPHVQPEAADVAASIPPEERLDLAVRELKAALSADLLEAVRSLSPSAFEMLIVQLLEAMKFGVPTLHRGGAGDEGIDGIVDEDRLGLGRIYIQAKRYKVDNPVGPRQVREFVGALTNAGAAKGVFVTSSSFTLAALDAIPKSGGAARIALINGEKLVDLMIEHDVGVRLHQVIQIKRPDWEALRSDDGTS